MKPSILATLTFVAGAAIGSVATYFITRKIERAKAEIYIQQQLEEDRKTLREKYADIETVKEEAAQDAVDEYCEEVRAQRKEMREIARKYQTADPRWDKVDFDSEEVKSALEKTAVEQNNPYIITEDEHYDGQGYDLRYLFYHPDAGDVADDQGHLVDPDEYVSAKIFNKFVEDDDVDEIFVRNPFLMCDIDLCKEMLK